ncbi:MAG: hypothetical protein JNL21_09515 [Myxococcales bacterium]|nr:hypothetical protein [Myxococcales bacterium]
MSDLERADTALADLGRELNWAVEEVSSYEAFPDEFSRKVDTVVARAEFFCQAVTRARSAIDKFQGTTNMASPGVAAAADALTRDLADASLLLQDARADLCAIRDQLERRPLKVPGSVKARLGKAAESIVGVRRNVQSAIDNSDYNRKAPLIATGIKWVVGGVSFFVLVQACGSLDSERTARARACYEAVARAGFVTGVVNVDECQEPWARAFLGSPSSGTSFSSAKASASVESLPRAIPSGSAPPAP